MQTIELSHGISLSSGAIFNYNKPEDSNVTIIDIANALGNICRFAGHLPYFYSVAQHAVNVSYLVPPAFALTALMHDTAEAFTNDLPTPLKHAIPVFKELEERIEAAMATRFGFTYPLPPEVKLADLQMLGLEKTYIKGDTNHWPVLDGVEYAHLRDKVDLAPWSPADAGWRFAARYDELTR